MRKNARELVQIILEIPPGGRLTNATLSNVGYDNVLLYELTISTGIFEYITSNICRFLDPNHPNSEYIHTQQILCCESSL